MSNVPANYALGTCRLTDPNWHKSLKNVIALTFIIINSRNDQRQRFIRIFSATWRTREKKKLIETNSYPATKVILYYTNVPKEKEERNDSY